MLGAGRNHRAVGQLGPQPDERHGVSTSDPCVAPHDDAVIEDGSHHVRAGADVVQLYTGLIYRGPALVREAALALQAERRRSP